MNFFIFIFLLIAPFTADSFAANSFVVKERMIIEGDTSLSESEAHKILQKRPTPSTRDQQNKPPKSESKSPSYLNYLGNHQDFLSMSRSYKSGKLNDVPHVMFLIDRARKQIYFINSKQYEWHKDFAFEHYIADKEQQEFFDDNYDGDQRELILGKIVYYKNKPNNHQYVIELWEGDHSSPIIWSECFKLNQDNIQYHSNSHRSIAIKAISLKQEESLAQWQEILAEPLKSSIKIITWGDIDIRDVEIVNAGEAVGRLVVYDANDSQERNSKKGSSNINIDAKEEEILVLSHLPLSLSPVSGVITNRPNIFLSHVSNLTRGWNVPNLFIKDAIDDLKKFNGKWVYLQAEESESNNESGGKYAIRLATQVEIDNKIQQIKGKKERKKQSLKIPKSDLSYHFLTNIEDQRAQDANKFGAKAANLGEIINAKLPGVDVPKGFSVPFYHYEEFVSSNNLAFPITLALSIENRKVRNFLLKIVRNLFLMKPFDEKLANNILSKIHEEYSHDGLFIRSSTSAEDLIGFSGAGLYDTIANVSYEKQGDEEILTAIKKVWGSVWNDAAVAARENVGIEGKDHLKIYASVLIQKGVDADSAGVAITANPYKKGEKDVVYINAKKGLGMRVVEGEKIPEQILYRKESNAIIVLGRSLDDDMLIFGENGGIKKVPVKSKRFVLDESKIRELVRITQNIEGVFLKHHNHKNLQDLEYLPQDIEWVIKNDQIYIVQARPFFVAE